MRSFFMRKDTDSGDGDATEATATTRATRPITATMKPSSHPKAAAATPPAVVTAITAHPTGVSAPSQRAAAS